MTAQGFKFRFNSTITIPADKTSYQIESYRIDYHASYGSKNNDLENEPLANIDVEDNELVLRLENPLKANRIYDIRLPAEIKSELSHLSSTRFWYTAHAIFPHNP